MAHLNTALCFKGFNWDIVTPDVETLDQVSQVSFQRSSHWCMLQNSYANSAVAQHCYSQWNVIDQFGPLNNVLMCDAFNLHSERFTSCLLVFGHTCIKRKHDDTLKSRSPAYFPPPPTWGYSHSAWHAPAITHPITRNTQRNTQFWSRASTQ